MTFDQIVERVETILIDLPSEVVVLIPQFVRDGQRRLEDDHGFRVMEKTIAYTTVTGQRSLGTKPSMFRSVFDLPVVQDGTGADWPIQWIDREFSIGDRYDEDDPLDVGQPRHVLEKDATFDVYPKPDGLCPSGTLFSDGQYRVRIPYLARELELSSSGVTENWFTQNAAECLIDYASAEGFLLNRNRTEYVNWTARWLTEKKRIVYLDKRSRFPRDLKLRPSPSVLTWGSDFIKRRRQF